MLLWWVGLILIAAALEPCDDGLTSVSRSYDVVYEPEFGSAVGVAELCLILFDALSLLFWRLLAVEDADSAFGSHDSYLSALVSEVDISAELLAVHHDVCSAICLTGDERNLGHCGLGKGVEELCAVTDDAPVLLIDAWHKSRHILDGHDGDIEAVAETHETRALL